MKRKVRILIFFDTKQHEDFYKHGGADLWVFEGAFWGNLFADDRPAFACYNKRLMEHRSLLSAAGRVCTISESESRSQCGFRVVGDCDELNSLSPGSKAYVWIPKFSQ
ncbi:MAG: hypothetical protein HWE24_02250 [Oceanospirillaceae bacterium]|nr:hypothetical protein [Oceanospirillaceae bacterium]